MPILVVWEVKTVPDLQVYAAANGLTSQSDKKFETRWESTLLTRFIGQSYVSAGLSPILKLIDGLSTQFLPTTSHRSQSRI